MDSRLAQLWGHGGQVNGGVEIAQRNHESLQVREPCNVVENDVQNSCDVNEGKNSVCNALFSYGCSGSTMIRRPLSSEDTATDFQSERSLQKKHNSIVAASFLYSRRVLPLLISTCAENVSVPAYSMHENVCELWECIYIPNS